MGTSNGPIWSRCSIAPTYPFRSYFQCSGKDRATVRITLSLIERRGGMRRWARENSRTISEKLRASLLRSFRRQHGEKAVCVRGVPNWDPREGQQPFWPNPNGVGNRPLR